MSQNHRILLHRKFLVIGLLLLLFASGCSGASKTDVSRSAPPSSAKTASSPSPAAGTAAQVPKIASEDRKVIETAQVTLETRDLTSTEKSVFDLLKKRSGRIDSSNIALDGNGRRSGNYSLRVSAGQLLDFINELAAIPDIVVRQRSHSSQDVSEEFIDVSARLENMRRHESRLREILAKANTVDEILKVEKELSGVRTQIESTTGRLKAMTGKIELSTLQLRISEVTVITETNFLGKLRGIIRDSWVSAGDVLLYLIATVIILSPIIILVIALVWWWRRRQLRKHLSQSLDATPPPGQNKE